MELALSTQVYLLGDMSSLSRYNHEPVPQLAAGLDNTTHARAPQRISVQGHIKKENVPIKFIGQRHASLAAFSLRTSSFDCTVMSTSTCSVALISL